MTDLSAEAKALPPPHRTEPAARVGGVAKPPHGAEAPDLAEIAATVRRHRAHVLSQARLAREAQQLRAAARMLQAARPDKHRASAAAIALAEQREAQLDAESQALLARWPAPLPPAHQPRLDDHGDILAWLMLDQWPGDGITARAADPDPNLPAALAIPAIDAPPATDATPAGQLAAALAEGFALVETHVARGGHIDDIAPQFFCTLPRDVAPGDERALGHAARRIWAVAMRVRYGANQRSQRLQLRRRHDGEGANTHPGDTAHDAAHSAAHGTSRGIVLGVACDPVEDAVLAEFDEMAARRQRVAGTSGKPSG